MYVRYCLNCKEEIEYEKNDTFIMCECRSFVDMHNSIRKNNWESLSEIQKEAISGYEVKGFLGFLKWIYGEILRLRLSD